MLRRQWDCSRMRQPDRRHLSTSFMHGHLIDSLAQHFKAEEGRFKADQLSTRPVSSCPRPFHSRESRDSFPPRKMGCNYFHRDVARRRDAILFGIPVLGWPSTGAIPRPLKVPDEA